MQVSAGPGSADGSHSTCFRPLPASEGPIVWLVDALLRARLCLHAAFSSPCEEPGVG